MMMRWILLLLAVMPAQLFSQELTEAEKEILVLQDQRSLGQGKLVAFLSHSNPQLRFRALMALANIQDTTTAANAAASLNDAYARVRAAAAFAVGQIGVRRAQEALVARLNRENDSTVAANIFEALGKIGDEKALDAVVEDTMHAGGSFIVSARGTAIARFALRGIKNERSIWYCFEQAMHPDAEVRWRALFALWRSAPHGLVDVEIAKREADLSRLSADSNVDVRVNLITLLGRSKSSYATDLLRALHDADRKNPNWLVGVQLTRSLAALSASQPELLNDMIEYLGSPNDHVRIACLQAVGNVTRSLVLAWADTVVLKESLLRLASTKNPSAELSRGEAFVALARLFPDEFSRRNFMSGKDLTAREQTKVLEALSHIPTGRSLSVMLRALDDPNVRVAMSAWDFIGRFLTPSLIMTKIRSANPDWIDARPALYRKILNSLARKDMAITHLVSNALADTTYFGIFKEGNLSDSLVLALNDAFTRLASPDDVEAMQAAAGAMGSIKDPRFVPTLERALKDPDKTVSVAAANALLQITGKDYSAQVPQSSKALHVDYDWALLESLRPSTRVTVETSKGIIVLQLLKDDAPFTVVSFVKLVKRRFYDGGQFHRVIPNFVIQGGDPRGDGWGGPGYAIRSEISFAGFSRGAAGIASAGKDTEGCQFFLTHQPTPHLDGRYTVFARVVEGQDVVDRIQVGDAIKRISVN